MKAHELAKLLLEGPDDPVVIEFTSEYDDRDEADVQSVSYTNKCVFISEHKALTPEELQQRKEAAENAERIRHELVQRAIDRERELQEKWGGLLP